MFEEWHRDDTPQKENRHHGDGRRKQTTTFSGRKSGNQGWLPISTLMEN
jgi:hypothetical protein